MKIPKLRRLPVNWDDFGHIEYEIPEELVHYKLQYDLDQEAFRLLKLGFIQGEILCFEDEFLYCFDMRAWRHGRFEYKFRLETTDTGATITDMWEHPFLANQFDEYFNLETAVGSLERAIRNIRNRELPVSPDRLIRQLPSMQDYEKYSVSDLTIDNQSFYKLIWGFVGQSQDDKWLTWFNFDSGEFNFHRRYKMLHAVQLQFDQIDDIYQVVEVRISREFPVSLEGVRGLISGFVNQNHYRYEVVSEQNYRKC